MGRRDGWITIRRECRGGPSGELYTPASDGTGGSFSIGRVIHSSHSVGFTGWIGGVAVFNLALSPAELNELSALSRERPLSAPQRP
ncbi:MAG: hypothetical protein EXS40_09445 [Opitutaceae bacterium]|nr:hypothetical protein [Opitutaceae bacterium]